MWIDFVCFGVIVLDARPTAHKLSQRISVVGWGYPMSTRMLRSATPSFALMNRAAYSASATEATTTGMMVLSARQGPLISVGVLLPR